MPTQHNGKLEGPCEKKFQDSKNRTHDLSITRPGPQLRQTLKLKMLNFEEMLLRWKGQWPTISDEQIFVLDIPSQLKGGLFFCHDAAIAAAAVVAAAVAIAAAVVTAAVVAAAVAVWSDQ